MKEFISIISFMLVSMSLFADDLVPKPLQSALVETTITNGEDAPPAKKVVITYKLRQSILDTLKVNGSEIAVITMANGGQIYVKFFPEDAPNTVKNFIMLSNLKFYDGLTFHRVEPGFVVQGGDPAGNGTGGAGYNIKAEFNSQHHLLGTLAMARSADPNSASSQFYICLNALPSLDNQYTVFGQVIRGMDVANGIRIGDKIRSIRIEPKTYSELEVICQGDPNSAIYTLPTPQTIKLPDYPATTSSGITRKTGGKINMRLHINKKGEIEDVKFLPSNMEFDKVYLKSVVKYWIFTPAKIGDGVIDDHINLSIEFKIINNQCEIRCINEQKTINL